nr:unnamed protein product [Haemonchus contortus]
MATGVIKLDSIAEAFEKAAKFSPHESASLSTTSERSSSGVSSASNSPTSSTSPVSNFSNSLPDGFGGPLSYSNPVFELDPAEYLSHDAQSRYVCTGVVALSDELWLDVEAHLKALTEEPSTANRSLTERCRHFMKSKWRIVIRGTLVETEEEVCSAVQTFRKLQPGWRQSFLNALTEFEYMAHPRKEVPKVCP